VEARERARRSHHGPRSRLGRSRQPMCQAVVRQRPRAEPRPRRARGGWPPHPRDREPDAAGVRRRSSSSARPAQHCGPCQQARARPVGRHGGAPLLSGPRRGHSSTFGGREQLWMRSVTGQVEPCLDLDQRTERHRADGPRGGPAAGLRSGARACAVTSGSLPVPGSDRAGHRWLLLRHRERCDVPSQHAEERCRPCGPRTAGIRRWPCRRGGRTTARGSASQSRSTRAPNLYLPAEILGSPTMVNDCHRVTDVCGGLAVVRCRGWTQAGRGAASVVDDLSRAVSERNTAGRRGAARYLSS
jgi:hypothetical protein